jgi:hypothetical protein
MTEVTTEPQSTREQMAELAQLLRCRDSGVIAGARGRICSTAQGLLVEAGPTASLTLLLQLVQCGLLDISETFMLARRPSEAEAPMLRELLGLQQGTAAS